jgi:hypothetical protein
MPVFQCHQLDLVWAHSIEPGLQLTIERYLIPVCLPQTCMKACSRLWLGLSSMPSCSFSLHWDIGRHVPVSPGTSDTWGTCDQWLVPSCELIHCGKQSKLQLEECQSLPWRHQLACPWSCHPINSVKCVSILPP